MKIQREYGPRCSPKAAPGLYTSVRRTNSPNTSRGTRDGMSACTATHLVTTSSAITLSSTLQKGAALRLLLLAIFLALLAVDAEARMRQRGEPVEWNVLPARVALAEGLGALVEPPQCLIDMPEESSLLAGEEE